MCVLTALITPETHTVVGSNAPSVIFEGQGTPLMVVAVLTAGHQSSAV